MVVAGTKAIFVGFISPQEVKALGTATDGILYAIGYSDNARAYAGIVRIIGSIIEVEGVVIVEAEPGNRTNNNS